MDSNLKKFQRESSPLGDIKLFFSLNEYYPKDISELIDEIDEIEFTETSRFFGIISLGLTLIKLDSCIYIPQEKDMALLSDLRSELEVSIKRYNGNLPTNMGFIQDVILGTRKHQEDYYLLKYDDKVINPLRLSN